MEAGQYGQHLKIVLLHVQQESSPEPECATILSQATGVRIVQGMLLRRRIATQILAQVGFSLNIVKTSPQKDFLFLVVDGVWTLWADFGDCSKTCGGGEQSRNRSCSNPAPLNGGQDCDGDAVETQACSTDACPRKLLNSI